MLNVWNKTSRRLLYQFILYCFLANLFVCLFIGLNYLSEFPNFYALTISNSELFFILSFSLISYVAQIALIYFFAFAIIIFIITLLPRVWLTLTLATIMSGMLLLLLMLETIVFKMFHMHYAILGWQMFRANALKQTLPLGLLETLELIGIVLLFLLVGSGIVFISWRGVKRQGAKKRFPYILTSLVFVCIAVSYGCNYIARNHGFFDNHQRSLIVKATRFLPYYDDLYQWLVPHSNQTAYFLAQGEKIPFPPIYPHAKLNYPKNPLHCLAEKKQKEPKNPLNILIIMIDTWRFDAMNTAASPHIYQFAQQSLQFNNHWSGGNCTKSGLFSFFYGLPVNYWDAMQQQQRGAAWIHQLVQANYDTRIFSSFAFRFPAFDQTIFRDIRSSIVATPGKTSVARDQNVTQHFKQFLAKRNPKQPFFSFLFYDAVHNYCETAKLQVYPFKGACASCNRLALTAKDDPKPYMNRYLNSVYFVDHEIKQVLDLLKQQDLLKNTIVVITADHGEEINDNHSGIWAHASAYSSFQLHVPFILYWPSKTPQTYQHFTTHYDFVPTITQQVLNCQNQASDYAIGTSLFNPASRKPLIAGGYMDYGILSQNRIMRIYPGGDYSLTDEIGHPIYQADLNPEILRKASHDLQHCFCPT